MPRVMKMKAHSLVASSIGRTSPIDGNVASSEGLTQDVLDNVNAVHDKRSGAHYYSPKVCQ